MKKSKFSISIYFAVFVAIMVVIDKTNYCLLALMCVLIHECGHLFMFVIFKLPIKSVSIKLFGVEIETDNSIKIDYKKEIFVSLGGCLANLLTILICLFLNIFYSCSNLLMVAAFSLLILTLNILPISYLDGGNVLKAILCNQISIDKSENIINITSVIFVIPLTIVALVLFVRTDFNISLIIVAIYLVSMILMKRK